MLPCTFQWIIMIAKPRKPPTEASSYRPISLLPIMSKVFEWLLLCTLDETMHIDGLLPIHQFGFQNKHSTIQQCHRVVNKIKESIKGKKMCISVFLNIQQAFDKVWHRGLLYKLKLHLPDHLYLLLKSYLSERYFQVKIKDEMSITPLGQEYCKAASWDCYSTCYILPMSQQHRTRSWRHSQMTLPYCHQILTPYAQLKNSSIISTYSNTGWNNGESK